MMPESIVTRFAPSPPGYLHIGHAYSALVAWHAAVEASGRFILRIEDIDIGRCKPEFEEAILEDLAAPDRIETGQRLVENQELRLVCDRLGDADALALATATVTHRDPRAIDGARLVARWAHAEAVRARLVLEADPRALEAVARTWISRLAAY